MSQGDDLLLQGWRVQVGAEDLLHPEGRERPDAKLPWKGSVHSDMEWQRGTVRSLPHCVH